MKSLVNLDRLQATQSGHIETIKSTVELLNGYGVVLNGYASRDVSNAVIPTDVATQEVLLVDTPEVIYDVRLADSDFSLIAGKPGRAYHLTNGDIFTISDNAFDGASVSGKYLIPQNGSFRFKADATGAGTRLVLEVIEKGKIGFKGYASTTVKVVKA